MSNDIDYTILSDEELVEGAGKALRPVDNGHSLTDFMNQAATSKNPSRFSTAIRQAILAFIAEKLNEHFRFIPSFIRNMILNGIRTKIEGVFR